MRDENCIFCKIVSGEIPAKKIYEDENYIAFLDLAPATKGHALVIPKDHFPNLYETPDEVLAGEMKVVRMMARRMKEKLGAVGFNLVQNNERAAEQTVFHFHIHMIPRYPNDGRVVGWKQGELTDEAAAEIIRLVSGE